MISVRNTDKIVNFLKEHKKPITTKELAKETKINAKYIGKYLKILESDKIITRKTSKNDKRVSEIELFLKKKLYFFKFGNKYLLHTRTRLDRNDFGSCCQIINSMNFPILIETIHTDSMKYYNQNPLENEDEMFFLDAEPEIGHKHQYFHIIEKNLLELLETHYGYSVHVYSKKEVRELREKKTRENLYDTIDFDVESVNLIRKKNGSKILKTPFCYLDYFILRLTGMLRVKNTITSKNKEGNIENFNDFYVNQKTELIEREFSLSLKAFEYYRNIYNFPQFKNVYINHRTKTERVSKEDKEFMKEIEKNRNDYDKEITESINRQHQEHKLRQKKAYENEFNFILEPKKEAFDKISCS